MRSADEPATRYAIRVAARLDEHWADWLGGLTLTAESGGTTLLIGDLPDQAALHGVLNRLRDSGIPLISVTTEDTRSTP